MDEIKRLQWGDVDYDKIEKFLDEDEDVSRGPASNPHDSASSIMLPQLSPQDAALKPRLAWTLNKPLSFRTSDAMVSTSTPNVGCQTPFKASSLQMKVIHIGTWTRTSLHEGDLTAKVYYARRRLVWEFLDEVLKTKMEIHWSNITAIKAIMHKNEDGILLIKLSKPPLFFREVPSKPRKHTTWHHITDFTRGEVQRYRSKSHMATFPAGVLNKHYGKLLQSDLRLLELSLKPFPCGHECSYLTMGVSSKSSCLQNNFNGLDSRYSTPMAQHNPINLFGPMTQPNQVNLFGPMYLAPMAQHNSYSAAAHHTTSIAAPLNQSKGDRNEGARMRQIVPEAGRMQISRPTNPYFEELSPPWPPPPTTNNFQFISAAHNFEIQNQINNTVLMDHYQMGVGATDQAVVDNNNFLSYVNDGDLVEMSADEGDLVQMFADEGDLVQLPAADEGDLVQMPADEGDLVQMQMKVGGKNNFLSSMNIS